MLFRSKPAAATAAAKPEPVFKSTKILSYFTAFKTDYVVSGLDNSTLFGGIDPYRGANSTPLNAVPMGLLFKGGVRDLFEDYRITGGIRIPLNFRGVEYFVTYDNLVKRLDKRLSFYHREMKESIGTDANVSHHTNLVEGQLRYPLDVFTSIRGLASVRNDRFTPLSTDRPLLDIDQYNRQYVSTRGEFVFDNTSELGLNLRTGTRYKVWVEALKGFQFELDESRTKLDFARGFTSVVGFDFRHYERILRHSIFAVRAAGAASFGSERFLYYLGGVDNPVVPSFSSVIPQPTSGNFAYTAFATNLRGFETNVRNGSSYALINAELRIPVWKYFSKVPPRSPFLQNFQLVGFFDVGSAWLGISPFSADNPLNTLTVHTTNSAVTVVVNYARDPFVYGYGGGLRTTLLGYFLRLDIAQGIETGEPQKLLWHFSVGTDF